jgi:hypothetical protein
MVSAMSVTNRILCFAFWFLAATLLSFAWVALMAVVFRVCRDETAEGGDEPRVGGGHAAKPGDVGRQRRPHLSGGLASGPFYGRVGLHPPCIGWAGEHDRHRAAGRQRRQGGFYLTSSERAHARKSATEIECVGRGS